MLLDVSMAIRSEGEEFPFLHRDEIPPQEIFGDTVTFEGIWSEVNPKPQMSKRGAEATSKAPPVSS